MEEKQKAQFWCGYINVRTDLIGTSGVVVGEARMKGDSQGRWWGFIWGGWEGGGTIKKVFIYICMKFEGEAGRRR